MRPIMAAFGAIFRRDMRMFLSYRANAFSQLFSALFAVALFYYISRLLKVGTVGTPDEYFAFVVVGLVILSVIQSTLILSTTLRAELIAGTFERILLSPFGPVRGALSMLIFPMSLAMILGFWTLLIAAAFFGLHLHWATVALAIPVGLISALAFSSIAMIVAAIVVVFKQAPGMGAVLAIISLVSGFYFPTTLLPGWIQWTSEVQPFTPAVVLMRHVLVGLPMPFPAWVYVLKLVGFVAVLLPVSTWLLARGVAEGQRRGTIIEY